MRGRFIGLLRAAASDHRDIAAKIAGYSGAAGEFGPAFASERLLVVATHQTALELDGCGVVLGSLFRPGTRSRLAHLEKDEAYSVAMSRGAHLTSRYWGAYNAFLDDTTGREGHGAAIVRAPFGELPCYYIEIDGAVIVASEVDVLIDVGAYTPAIDWHAVARHVAARTVRGRETCLAGLNELGGGERLSLVGGKARVEPLWSPWSFATRERQIDDVGEAVQRVRGGVASCVASRASEFDNVLLMLSGGLDSSVVAACLAKQPHRVTCLNLVTPDAGGDERRYARTVAAHLGFDMIEHAQRVDAVDVTRSTAARLPRPTARLFSQDYEAAALGAGKTTGARAVFDGGGGDNVFCSLQSAAPAADRLLTTGLDSRFFATAADIGRLAPASLWAVASAAIKRAWLRGPAHRRPCDTHLLSLTATCTARQAPAHPWLDAPRGALPGKASHIAALLFAQSYVEGLDPQDEVTHVAPLLAQPIVETCLKVPSWLWFEDGRNRSIARRAFADDLPAAITKRRSKGSPNSFSAAIFEANRRTLRAFLADGAVARHDLLDRNAMLAILDAHGPVRGDDFERVLHFADVEAWAQAWSSRRR